MYSRGGIVLVLLIGLSSHVASAELVTLDAPLSLTQAVARVLVAGFDVRTTATDVATAEAEVRTRKAMRRPQVTLGGTAATINLPQLGMPVARQAYASATAVIPLFVPGAGASIAAANADRDASSLDVETARSDAAYTVIRSYRRAQLATETVDARDAALRERTEELRRTEARIAQGAAAPYLVAHAQAALAEAARMREDAAAERDEALLDLATLLDVQLDGRLTLADPLTLSLIDGTRANAQARALAQRPSVLAAQRRVTAADAALIAARAAYRPSAQVNAQSYNGVSSPNLGGTGGQIGITLSFPLIDDGSRSATIVRAVAARDRESVLLEQAELSARRDVAVAWRELDAARINLDSAHAEERNAQEQLRVARLREDAGKATQLEMLDALSITASAREATLNATARYDNAVAAIHHAAGDDPTHL
jgi:outer membrane protein TolC